MLHTLDGAACRVSIQTGQFLLFRESAAPVPAYDNHLIAIYVGRVPGDAVQVSTAPCRPRSWTNPSLLLFYSSAASPQEKCMGQLAASGPTQRPAR